MPLRKNITVILWAAWGRDGLPRDVNERGANALELLTNANERGIGADRIWFDPIATPASISIRIMSNPAGILAMLRRSAPEAKSILGYPIFPTAPRNTCGRT